MKLDKIIIAPDSFKGTLSADEASEIIENGIHKVKPDVMTLKLPVADGGEGTIDFFLSALEGKKITISVTGPNFNSVEASYVILNDNETAIIEMAQASGICLVEEKKDPSKYTTYGTGQLILNALDKGCRKIIIGIGGSATNDGGIGMAAALGAKFLDKSNKPISLNGLGLSKLNKIDLDNLDNRIKQCNIEVACDVDIPLYGERGAAYIFGPQKGADKKTVQLLNEGLINYANILRQQTGIDVQQIPGSGAAGGLGAGLVTLLGASLKSGIDIILKTIRFDELIKDADLIITGEGRIDGQSLHGKVPIGIAKRAKQYNIPVIAIVGSIGDSVDEIYNSGIQTIFSINREPLDFEIAKNHTKKNLLMTTEAVMRLCDIFIDE